MRKEHKKALSGFLKTQEGQKFYDLCHLVFPSQKWAQYGFALFLKKLRASESFPQAQEISFCIQIFRKTLHSLDRSIQSWIENTPHVFFKKNLSLENRLLLLLIFRAKVPLAVISIGFETPLEKLRFHISFLMEQLSPIKEQVA